MKNTLRKIALRTIIPLLCGLIAVNAYLVWNNVKLIQKTAAQRVQASEMQEDISNLLLDFQDMETGQRGYLLTGDPSYLEPYNNANARLAAHSARLRSSLTGKQAQDRSLEAQLESVAASKIAEMKETIRLRELGYRHRAFQIVNSNRGQELMNQARTTLAALSAAQTGDIARYDRGMKESVAKTIKHLVLGNLMLLAATVIALLVFDRYSNRLEIRYARTAEQLEATSLQLEQFTSTVFHDVRALVGKMRSYAGSLLEGYGGFLPRQGQEKAERIEHEAGQTILLLDNLFKTSPSEASAEVLEVQPLQRLSA